MKKIIKNFNNIVKKTIIKVQNKINYNSNLKFGNLYNTVKKIILKKQNKTNNNSEISDFNKYFIIFIGSLFLYLFYLLTPLLYDKNWVQNKIESKLLEEFKTDISISSDISYRILPSPHFFIKNSKLLINDSEKLIPIANIKNLKVFINQAKFFDKRKLDINKLIINNANFSLLISDLKLLRKSINNVQFSSKKIKINNSQIFLKNNFNEIITIIKINKIIRYYDDIELFNFFNLKGEAFNVPFTFDIKRPNDSTKNNETNFKVKSLKLNIHNKYKIEKNKSINGDYNISVLKYLYNTKYEIIKEFITFKSSDSNIKKSIVKYNGALSINPFDLNLNIDLGNYKISKLFNINPILIEFVKSELLFNDNISVKTSIEAFSTSKIKNKIFQKAKINFQIINGKVNFNSTKLINDDIGSLEINNSNLFVANNDLVLNTDMMIEIKNSDRLFSFLNTNKKSKRYIKNILINLDYNFLTNQVKFNNIKIDGNKLDDQILDVMDGINDSKDINLNKSRRLLNELFDIYEG